MKSYNWGIIGPGNIARDFANDIKYVSVPQKITAVLSHRKESADEFADEFNIAGRYIDAGDFFENGHFDIVYIATPHPLHFDEIKSCLERRIPVLCEKPIVINHEQYEELLKLSVRNNTFMMEGMWVRFLPSFRKMLELLEQKKIGEIVSMKAAMSFKADHDESSRFYDPEKGGGSLLDLGVYCIFLSTLLLGKPESIKSVARLTDKKIDEACGILLSYKHGRYSVLESSLLIKQDRPAEIYGTDGILRILNPWFGESPGIEIEMYSGQREKIPLNWEGHGLQFEIEEVIRCVSGKKIESDLMPPRLNREVLRIMDEIREQIHVTYDSDN